MASAHKTKQRMKAGHRNGEATRSFILTDKQQAKPAVTAWYAPVHSYLRSWIQWGKIAEMAWRTLIVR
jgi:hypothetical protein